MSARVVSGFVGRQDELRELLACLDRALAAGWWSYLVTGTIGKTRPCEELAAAAGGLGVGWRGRCARSRAGCHRSGRGGRFSNGGDLCETVDATARAAYKARLVELEAELDAADGTGDTQRPARAQAERDALLQQLSSAYGLAGRARRTGDPAERARTAVTARIGDAIRRIEAQHPAMGRHLARSVRTGTLCSYHPDRPTSWQL